MQQPSVASSRQIRSATAGSGGGGDAADDAEAVSSIELRRLQSGDRDGAGASGRKITKRFLVSGHWRQQACAPGRSLRKPLYIDGYLKGPDRAPLMEVSDRVYVWRR